jgi:NAD(P)-dependent dehydrogenase (short-subunit alcohol dehydrogenase family)
MTDRKIAVVTGGNKGIGLELSRQLAKAGVQVVLTARNATRGRKAQEQLHREGLDMDFHPLDVNDEETMKTLAADLAQQYGKLDYLVNNAGIFSDPSDTILTLRPETAKTVLDTNTFGPMLMVQHMLPLLKKAGRARVLNISSGLGQLNDMAGDYPAYSLSKTALNAVTRMQAAELANFNITVNCLCPGWVRTDMGGSNAERSPEEAVSTIVPLLLDETDNRTGMFLRDGNPIPW